MKIGIVAVSRDCFPESLSVNRRKALVEAYKANGCNALCVYLGNFGPGIAETLLAKHFDGSAMYIAAAEESQADIMDGRGDDIAVC